VHRGLARAYVLNSLHVDTEVDADGLVTALDELYADYGHRRALVERADVGECLAPEMRRRRWLVEREVVMALRRPRDRAAQPGLAREVDIAAQQVVQAATVREEPYGRDEEVVRQLVGMRAALAEAVRTARFWVGSVDGVDAAVTTLYSDGTIAQVEDVATLTAHRRRGIGRAVVSAAVDAALEMGHALVFIVADDEDWPKDLYERLGFDRVGHSWAFTRTERAAPQVVPRTGTSRAGDAEAR
jgi:ribosomal protein S18 acetylase RimI-like enzyme